MGSRDVGEVGEVGEGRLPDALVLGVPRAGTTSLAAWLGAHPDAWVPPDKELEFFNANFEQGLGAYRAAFADAGDVAVACEATPDYLLHPTTLQRIVDTLPGARFVVLLREPVARAWSHFNYNRQLGIEYRSFRRALRDEQRDPPRRPLGFRTDDLRLPFAYLGTGRYAEHLARLDALVGPDRTLVRLSAANLADRRPDPLDPDLARRLRARMQPHNQRLAERLGRALPASWSVAGG